MKFCKIVTNEQLIKIFVNRVGTGTVGVIRIHYFPGKRQCLGEQFARMELYLMMAALLQNFTFSAPEGEEIDIRPVRFPIINRPNEKQKFVIKIRHQH